MPAEDVILAHVEEVEYLREIARQEADDLLDNADPDDILDDPAAFVEALLAAILTQIAPYTARMAAQAQLYAEQLGYRADDIDIESAESDAKDHLILLAAPALVAALLPIETRIQESLDGGVSPHVLAKTIESDAAWDAFLVYFAAQLKRSIGDYMREVESNVIAGAVTMHTQLAIASGQPAPVLVWISVHDKGTCRDIFEDSCWPRHQTGLTLEQWKEFGLPRSLHTLCQARCRCQLLDPAEAAGLLTPVNASEAIKRGRTKAHVDR